MFVGNNGIFPNGKHQLIGDGVFQRLNAERGGRVAKWSIHISNFASLHQALIKVAVGLRRNVPAKVHGHRLTLYVTPQGWTGPQDESTPDRPKQRPGITVLENKPAGDTVRQVFQGAV